MKSRHQNVSILDFIGAKDEGDGGDNFTAAIRRAKLQSNRHQTYQHPAFCRSDALPMAQTAVSEIALVPIKPLMKRFRKDYVVRGAITQTVPVRHSRGPPFPRSA